MREVKAYIQSFMLDKVTRALRGIHIRGMSVSGMRGFGKEKDESYPHHHGDELVDFTPKVKIEIVCEDAEVDEIVETIRTAAHTGRRGDGKIFIYPVESAMSIRTGETGENAI